MTGDYSAILTTLFGKESTNTTEFEFDNTSGEIHFDFNQLFTKVHNIDQHKVIVLLFTTILILFGLLANFINGFVMVRHLLQKSGIYVVLLALCCSDVMATCAHGYSVIMAALKMTAYTDIWSCRFFNYFWYSCLQWSSWCTVLVSLEQLWSVMGSQGLQQERTTPRRALVLIITSAISVFGYNMYLFPAMTYSETNPFSSFIIRHCKPEKYRIVFMLHLVMYATLPYLLVVICNLLIICRLRKTRNANDNVIRKHITGRLLAMTFTSFALILPYSVIFFLVDSPKFHPDSTINSRIHLVLRDVGRLLLLLNHTLVHPFYLLTSATFRHRLKTALGCHRRHRYEPQSTHVTQQSIIRPENTGDNGYTPLDTGDPASEFNSLNSVATNTSFV